MKAEETKKYDIIIKQRKAILKLHTAKKSGNSRRRSSIDMLNEKIFIDEFKQPS